MSQRFFNPAPQFFYSGTPAAPLAGGLMYFYVPGTTTPKDTYSDNALTTPNTNPVVLSSSGVLPNVFLDGSYKVILQDKNGVQQPGWPRDSVNSIQDLAFANWDSTITYGEGGANIVTASDGNYYVSIQANNLAHEPSASPLWWSLWPFPSLAKGVVFAGTGTAVVAVGPGANGTTVIADSGETAGIRFGSTASPASVVLAVLNPSASANVDFLTTFTSAYDEYEIIGSLAFSTDARLEYRFANAGVVDSGSNYGSATGAASVSGASIAVASTSGLVCIGNTESATAYGMNFWMRVKNANSAAALKSADIKTERANDAAGFSSDGVGGFYIGAAASGIRFFPDSGTVTGEVKVIGIRNS